MLQKTKHIKGNCEVKKTTIEMGPNVKYGSKFDFDF